MENLKNTPAVRESDEEMLARGLTRSDIENQKIDAHVNAQGNDIPTGLAEALAREEIFQSSESALRRVPEGIFIRDILPAIAGKLGQVDMRWWQAQFGATTRGFIVEDQDKKTLFEFPPLVPSPDLNSSKNAKPVGDMMANYRNRAQISPDESQHKLKQDLRGTMNSGGMTGFIYNIATVERICRRYGESIVAEAKPEFRAVIEQGVEGLDEALGKLEPFKGLKASTADNKAKPIAAIERRDPTDDDDEQTGAHSFD